MRNWRQKKKDEKERQDQVDDGGENEALDVSTTLSGYAPVSSFLTVRMQFPNRRKNASRVRISRAMSKARPVQSRNICKGGNIRGRAGKQVE